jgi:glyoxylase I family protein
MQKPAFSAIHHVAIIVSDYQKARHFYVDILGLPIIRENFRPERQDYKLDLQLNDAELEIFAIKNPPKRPSFPEAAGLRHLAFKTTDIEATVAYLNSHGIDCEERK